MIFFIVLSHDAISDMSLSYILSHEDIYDIALWGSSCWTIVSCVWVNVEKGVWGVEYCMCVIVESWIVVVFWLERWDDVICWKELI